MGESLRADVDPLNNTNFQTENLFGIWVAPGFTDSDHYTPYLLQGGLGIPSRDYYLGTSAKMKAAQAAYKTYVATALKLAGVADSDKKAAAIFDLETKIAKAQESIVDSQDVVKANNVWARADFAKKAPGLDWDQFFQGAGLPSRTTSSSGSLRPSPACPSLSPDVRSIPGKRGSPSIASIISRRYCPRPSWMRASPFTARRCRARPSSRTAGSAASISPTTRWAMRWARLYAAKYFPPESKAKAEVMVKNIIAAWGRRIDALTWMTPATKAKAKEKLFAPLCRHRLSRKMARLFRPVRGEGRCPGQPGALGSVRISLQHRPHRQAGGPPRMVDDAADRQCRESAACRTR